MKEKRLYPVRNNHELIPLGRLKGIGPGRISLLEKRGITSVWDLLFLLPLRYQDRRKIRPIGEAKHLHESLFRGEVIFSKEEPGYGKRKRLFRIRVYDGTGTLDLVWFHYRRPMMDLLGKRGVSLLIYGKIRYFRGIAQIIHPEVAIWDDKRCSGAKGEIVPVYPSVQGISGKILRNAISQALAWAKDVVQDPFGKELLAELGLPGLWEALKGVHSPPVDTNYQELCNFRSPYHRRLIFDRFFMVIFSVLRRRYGQIRQKGPEILPPGDALSRFMRTLPFRLTGDQIKAIEQIKKDMERGRSMHRLVQGDVGCGKTVIAAATAFMVVESGYQVAFMAPTQILATQHYNFFLGLNDLNINPVLLTGALSQEAKKKAYEGIISGSYDIVIGTQALIQEQVRFNNLGLVIVDEQHRFGVRQRALLEQKGDNPHVLVMTATPIPRTLAMAIYADLDVSTVKQRPEHYQGVETELVHQQEKKRIYETVKAAMLRGEQVMVICPVIEDVEGMNLKNAIDMHKALRRIYYPPFRVELVHGALPPDEKDLIMERFRNGKIDLLVATSVIEVGVHAPGATTMVIEHPERFGLAQLHQLRGRVGRGVKRGKCILVVSDSMPQEVYERLEMLAFTDDGFEIAEKDLLVRGQGELNGLRQSGAGELDMEEVMAEPGLLLAAKKKAEHILSSDPELEAPEHALIKKWLVFHDDEGMITNL